MKIFIFSIFILSLLYLVINPQLHSQFANPGSITWERLYDGPNNFLDGGYDVCEADSGNFYLVGYTHLGGSGGNRILVIKINAFGDTLWTRVIGNQQIIAYACASSSDGGCVITGARSSPFTIKLDKDGNIVWNKTYPGTFTQAYRMINTSEGGYAACGRLFPDSAIVFKVDSLGNLEWMKIFGANYYKHFEDIKEIGNGFILTGNVRESTQGTRVPMLVKINTSGDLVWEKRYDQLYRNSARSVNNLNDNQYLFGGTVFDTILGDYRGYFVRTDTSGSNLFSYSFSSSRPEFIQDIKVLNLNSYIIVLDQAQPSAYNFTKVLISDSNGNISKEKVFSAHTYTFFNTTLPLLNGDHIFVGEARLIGDLHSDFYAVRTDSALNYIPLSINSNHNIVPTGIRLYPAYPNPFNPAAQLKFDISKKGNVKIIIYDLAGRVVSEVLNQDLLIGQHIMEWNASSQSSGVYFAVLYFENKFIQSQKLILIK
jgi:hypothetical protein